MKDYYEQLRKICAEKGTTVYAIEKATGVSNGCYRKWAKSSPTADKLIEISNLLGVSVDYLLGHEVESRPLIIERPNFPTIEFDKLIDDSRYLEITKVYAGAPNDEAKSFLKGNFIETAKNCGIDTVPLIGY